MESKRFEHIRDSLLNKFNSCELVISMLVDDFEESGRGLFNRIKDNLNGASTDDDLDATVIEIIKEADEFISGIDPDADLELLTDEERVKVIFYNSIIININSLYTKEAEGNLDGID